MSTNSPPASGQGDPTLDSVTTAPRNGPRTARPRAAAARRPLRRPVMLLAIAGLLLAVTGPVAASAATPARPASLKSLTEQLVADGAVGAIGVARHGQELAQAAAGIASLASGQPMRPGDRYRAGSITKTFVAVAVLQLVGQGRLRLGDPIDRWLPGLVPGGGKITIRELLNHTSGLQDYFNDRSFDSQVLAGQQFIPAQLVAIANALGPVFPPGTSWAYSNTDYILLGLIVEKATGHSLQAELARRIFLPMHLDDTSFPVDQTNIPGDHAHGYIDLPGAPPLDVTTRVNPSATWAAGALVSTVSDITSFYRDLFSGRLLRPDLLAAMTTTVPTNIGADYGLGIFSLTLPCGTAWGHNGDFFGYNNIALTSPDGRRQAGFMINLDVQNGAPPAGLEHQVQAAAVSAFCS
jgi:D-alanyl-D-alanine carboxypeptidase